MAKQQFFQKSAVHFSLAATFVGLAIVPAMAQSQKKTTSDPYFSSIRQSAAAQQSPSQPFSQTANSWSPPNPPKVTPSPGTGSASKPAVVEDWQSQVKESPTAKKGFDLSQIQIDSQTKIKKNASNQSAAKNSNNAAKTSSRRFPTGQRSAWTPPVVSTHQTTPLEKLVPPAPAPRIDNARSIIRQAPTPDQTAKSDALSQAINDAATDTVVQKLYSTAELNNEAPPEPEPESKNIKFDSKVQPVAFVEPPTAPAIPQSGRTNRSGSGAKGAVDSPAGPSVQQNGSGYRIADSSVDVSATAAASESPVGESFELTRVMALVGGEPIFLGDMIFEAKQLIEKHMQGAPQDIKDKQLEVLLTRLLPKYIDQKMLYAAAIDGLPEGADVEDILVQAERSFNKQVLPRMVESSGSGSTSQFDANLRLQGTSLRQVRRNWAKDQVSRFFLADKIQINDQVTHWELLKKYRENYESYKKRARCRWEQIEIQFSRAGGRLAAKDKIEQIYDRVVHGASLSAIAKTESHGFRAKSGGEYDWTTQDSLVKKEIDQALFSIPPGSLSEIIETNNAFHFVRVIEREDEHYTPFTEAQVEIKKKILGQRRELAFKKQLDKLRREVTVEYVSQ